jgi:hypothetical protein
LTSIRPLPQFTFHYFLSFLLTAGTIGTYDAPVLVKRAPPDFVKQQQLLSYYASFFIRGCRRSNS